MPKLLLMLTFGDPQLVANLKVRGWVGSKGRVASGCREHSRRTPSVLTGYSRGTHGVLTGTAPAFLGSMMLSNEILTGYSRGAHGVLTGSV